jgi:hypothetical protein
VILSRHVPADIAASVTSYVVKFGVSTAETVMTFVPGLEHSSKNGLDGSMGLS